jgi:hypothetical protein
MPTIDELGAALEKADAAGDTASAKQLAGAIKAAQAKAAWTPGSTDPAHREPGAEPSDVSGLEMIARSISDHFKPKPPEEVSAEEAMGKVGGGALSGGIVSGIAPRALQAAGKVLPGKYGEAAMALGKGMEMVPAKQRIAGGAAAGAMTGGVEAVAKREGWPDAVELGASLVGAQAGEAVSNLAFRETKNILSMGANIARGNLPGVMLAAKNAVTRDKEADVRIASKLQEDMFGKRLPTPEAYVNQLETSENRRKLADLTRKADPSLPPIGVEDPAIAAARQAGKIVNAPDMASTIYRERMFQGVTDAVQKGKTFSTTPAFQRFEADLKAKVALGEVSPGEASSLLKGLKADQAKGKPATALVSASGKPLSAPTSDPKVLAGYAESVDQKIRDWGKQLETGPSSGAKAGQDVITSDVRAKLRGAYNEYLQTIGLGRLESQYRTAYQAEKVAKAKDMIPSVLNREVTGKGSPSDLEKLAYQLGKDPSLKPILSQEINKKLANTPADEIGKAFGRLQPALVSSNLMTLAELAPIRQQVALVQKIADEGERTSVGERLKRFILLTLASQGGAATGGAIGKTATPAQ